MVPTGSNGARRRLVLHIERLQVEGGFLDGLDIKFVDGLNVIIGARGTGKTSIIELLRFALGARNHTPEAERRSRLHAEAILDGGEVTVTAGDIIETVTVSRSTGDSEPKSAAPFPVPLVLSQTEIETLGLSDTGRLQLLDSFVSDNGSVKAQEAAAISAVRSAFKEISDLQREIEVTSQGLDQITALRAQIAELETQELAYKEISEEVASKQHALSELNSQVSALVVEEEMLARFIDSTQSRAAEIEAVLADCSLETWDGESARDPLAAFRQAHSQAMDLVRKASVELRRITAQAAGQQDPLRRRRVELDVQTRALRAEISKVAEGAGVVARQLGQAKTSLAQLMARQKLVQEREARLLQLRARRDERLVELELVREKRFANRQQAATEITQALAPQIKIEVTRLGQFGQYAASLVEAFRGSGMKYNELAALISERVSPRELVDFLDSNDYVGLAEAVEIPRDRAARLIGHLRDAGAADVVTSDIEDDVTMKLLDGVDHKPIEDLSAGQRCTVVLAMVLQHTRRIIIIDQPEDHLDNAYIANTVVKALTNRKNDTQIILSTHNANIPVLGGAELVVELSSDGRNGFVQVAQPLDHADAVASITKVMEGGIDAFRHRAGFYDDHYL